MLDLAGAEVAAALGMAGVELGVIVTVLGSGMGAETGEIVGEGVTGFGAGTKPGGGEKADRFGVETNPEGFGAGTNPGGGESGLGLETAGGERGDLDGITLVAEVCSSGFRGWLASTFSIVLSHAGPELTDTFSTGFTSSFSRGSSL